MYTSPYDKLVREFFIFRKITSNAVIPSEENRDDDLQSVDLQEAA